jgi:hypothetical protein
LQPHRVALRSTDRRFRLSAITGVTRIAIDNPDLLFIRICQLDPQFVGSHDGPDVSAMTTIFQSHHIPLLDLVIQLPQIYLTTVRLDQAIQKRVNVHRFGMRHG